MLDGMTLKETINQEITKFKSMDREKKWDYFKTYYLKATILIIIAFALLLHLLYSIILGKREVLASGCFVNVAISEEGVLFLTDEYMTFCGKTDRDVTTVVALDESVNVYGELPVSTDAYEEMALLAQLSAGEYQYMILDEAGLERFAQLELYADLEEILDEQQMINLEDRIVYLENQAGKDNTASAISLSGTGFAVKYQLMPKDTYLVFVNIEPDMEKNQRFVNYILGVNL